MIEAGFTLRGWKYCAGRFDAVELGGSRREADQYSYVGVASWMLTPRSCYWEHHLCVIRSHEAFCLHHTVATSGEDKAQENGWGRSQL